MRAEDRLHAIAHHHHAGRAECLELFGTGLGDVVQLHAQSRDACIQAGDVAATAERADELQGEVLSAGAAERLGFFSRFAAGRSEVKCADGECEDAVIHQSPDRPDDKEPQRVVRLRKQHDVIDEAVREGEAVFDPQCDAVK